MSATAKRVPFSKFQRIRQQYPATVRTALQSVHAERRGLEQRGKNRRSGVRAARRPVHREQRSAQNTRRRGDRRIDHPHAAARHQRQPLAHGERQRGGDEKIRLGGEMIRKKTRSTPKRQ